MFYLSPSVSVSCSSFRHFMVAQITWVVVPWYIFNRVHNSVGPSVPMTFCGREFLRSRLIPGSTTVQYICSSLKLSSQEICYGVTPSFALHQDAYSDLEYSLYFPLHLSKSIDGTIYNEQETQS